MLQGISLVNTDWPAYVCGTASHRGVDSNNHTDRPFYCRVLVEFDMCPNVPYGSIYI